MKKTSLTLALLLLAALNVCAQCKYCESYEDFLEDKWQPLDTVFCTTHSKGYQFMFGVSNYKLKTGDDATEEILRYNAFAVMMNNTLFVNSRNLRYEKVRIGKGFCKAARIGEHSLIITGPLIVTDKTASMATSGASAAAGMVAGAFGGIAAAAAVGGVVGGVGGGMMANKSLKNKVCYLITSSADDKGRFNIQMFEDKMMDKLLLSRDLIDLHNAYYAEKDKNTRKLASRVIPILQKAGIID